MQNGELKKKAPRHVIDIETEHPGERNKLILTLMWPALCENVLATLVSMADTIMVSALGKSAINAVGLCTQPRFIVFSAFMALGTGTTALVARAKGAGNQEEANHALAQSLLLALGIVLLVCLAMLFWYQPLIRFIAGKNISEETVLDAFAYFRVQIVGFPLLGLTFIMNAALRGAAAALPDVTAPGGDSLSPPPADDPLVAFRAAVAALRPEQLKEAARILRERKRG